MTAMTVRLWEIRLPDSTPDTLIWAATDHCLIPYELVDPRPIVADDLGHAWNPWGDEPVSTCLLCDTTTWRYESAEKCPQAGGLGELNARRDEWIAAHRCDGKGQR